VLSSLQGYNWKMISDPLYGYVYFNVEVEEPVINNVLIQRLRYIMQLQTAHLVYPGAVHTRFQHSTGVMHLAGLMSEDMVNKIIAFYGKEVLDGYEPGVIVEAARLAGLLHDVGHAAFSHAYERGILWRKNVPRELSNHEKIGLLLIKNLLMDQLERAEKQLPGLIEVLNAILGEEEPKGVLKIFRWLVKEGFYPADVVDFLRRDSYYAGTIEYGSIQYERLYRNTYPLIEGDRVYLVLDRIAIGEFKQYMNAKANMYEHVYYHSVCRSFDKILYETLELLDEELMLTQRAIDLLNGRFHGYLELTDTYMYSVMMHKAFTDNSKLGYLCRRIMIDRKPEWKRAGRELVISPAKGLKSLGVTLKLILDSQYRLKVLREIEEFLVDSLKSQGIGEGELWIDILDIAPIPRSSIYPGGEESIGLSNLLIGKRVGGRIVLSEDLNLFTEELPLKILIRAYVPRNLYSADIESKITSLLSQAARSILDLDLEEAIRVVRNIYTEYLGRDYSKYRITA